MNTRLTLERSVKERLENRILFDAVPEFHLLNAVELAANGSHDSAQIQSLPIQAIEQSAPREIIFVDERVSDSSQLIASIISKQPDRYFEIRTLSASQGGIEQITSYLKNARNVTAIHVFSHGDDGALLIGSTNLTNESLANYADQLASWRQALDPQADLLLYGCRVAAGAQGQHFVRELSLLTGADVAASNNLSGQSIGSDADWDLEFQTGIIEARSPVADSDLIDWFGLLSVSIAATETRVNTTTGGNQVTHSESPNAVALDSAGNYVVVWTSAGQDGSGNGVYAQRYLANGATAGTEFRINTTTAGDQQNASVARRASGDFVVTWSSNNQDGSGWGIYARRFDANGAALSGEILVNTSTANAQQFSTIAIDSAGNFAVAWTSTNQDGSGTGIYAQRFNALGVKQGGEILVNTTTANNQSLPSIAMSSTGSFVLTWTSTAQDGSNDGVYFQRFDAAGTKLGVETRANTTTLNDQRNSRVAIDPLGNFAIVWASNVQDGSGWGIYAQRYNPSGVAQGVEFQVNTTTANNQQFPTIGMDNGGNFTITWTSTNQDGNNNGVYGRRFDSLGNGISSEFLVNTTTNNAQQFSSLAVSSSGDFVTVWSGNVNGDSAGIGLQQAIVDYRENAVYGIDNNSPFNIFEVDPNTGSHTVIGTALFASASLARDAESNRLYYTEFNVTNGRVGYFDPARNANVLLGNLGGSVPYLDRKSVV